MERMEREEFIEKLKEISALVDDNEVVMEGLKEIQEGILPWLDGAREENNDDYKEKYEELKKKYRDRFFSGAPAEEEEIVEEEEKEEITIEDLFEEGK